MTQISETSPALHQRWRRSIARTATCLVSGLVVLAIGSAPASAGDYHVYACTDPATGVALPTNNWTQSGSGPTFNTCATSPVLGGLGVEAIPQFGGTKGNWTFVSPADTTITAATLYRSAVASYRALAYWAAPLDEYSSADAFDSCQGSSEQSACNLGSPSMQTCERLSCYPPGDVLNVPSSHLPSPRLALSMRCLAAGCGGSEVMHSADITLSQTFGPTAAATGGPLTTQPVLQGSEAIQVNASDPGAGVYQAIFEVDGQVVARQIIDPTGGMCQPYATATDGTPIFLNPAPCPQSVSGATVTLETSHVADGVHQLSVLVSDAAGNTTTILSRSVAFNNRGEYTLQVQREQQEERQARELLVRGVCNAACDDLASMRSISPSRAARKIVREYQGSAVTLRGRLFGHSGPPIVGATVELWETPSYRGAASVRVTTTRTDGTGAWSLRVPRGPSRLLRVGYRARSKDDHYAAQLQYREVVAAPISLRGPRGVWPGHSFTFHGRTLGGYVPAGGLLVSLEILYGGRWREIALLHTSKDGAFGYSYTFAAVALGDYRFRAAVPRTALYPYAPAASSVASIRLHQR